MGKQPKSMKSEMKKLQHTIVTTNSTKIQKIRRDYYDQLLTNKMDNLEEIDKFWERNNLPRVSQEERENMNRPITSTEIESVI